MKRVFALLIAIALVTGSCVTQKKCAQKFPPVSSHDSIYIERVKLDTVKVRIPGDTTVIIQPFNCPDQDTVVIENSKQKIKYVVKDSMIYIQATCKTDSFETVINSLETELRNNKQTIIHERYIPKIYKIGLFVGISLTILLLLFIIAKIRKWL